MKIYVVSTGIYSDWRIRGIFSTGEKAQIYMQNNSVPCQKTNLYEGEENQLWRDGFESYNDLEEWIVDEKEELIAKPYWSVCLCLEDGALKSESSNIEKDLEKNKKNNQPSFDLNNNSEWGQNKSYVSVVSYISRDHALRLAAEARQQWLRENQYQKKET